MPGGALPTQNVSLTEAVSASQASARRRSLSLTLQRAVKVGSGMGTRRVDEVRSGARGFSLHQRQRETARWGGER